MRPAEPAQAEGRALAPGLSGHKLFARSRPCRRAARLMSQSRQSFLSLTRLSRTVAGLSKFLNLTVAGFAGRAVLQCDIESGKLPILSVDERFEVEQSRLRRAWRRPSGPSPLAPPATARNSGGWRFIVEGVALGVLALIRGIDVVDEGRRRRVRRLTAVGASAIAPKQARRKRARRRSLRFCRHGDQQGVAGLHHWQCGKLPQDVGGQGTSSRL